MLKSVCFKVGRAEFLGVAATRIDRLNDQLPYLIGINGELAEVLRCLPFAGSYEGEQQMLGVDPCVRGCTCFLVGGT